MNRYAFLLLAGLTLSQATTAGVYDDTLFFANQNETDKVVDLLRRGMDVNTTDPQGNSLLMIAARGNNIELARFLLDNRANPQRKNRYGDTALMLAALQGHTEIVRLMVERKIDPNHGGWNPLHYAAFEGRAEIISLLLAGGADINLKAPNGQSALMLAAKRGHLEAVRILVGANADLSVSDPEEGTAQDMAQKANHTDVATFLKRAAAGR
ncbi:MAG: ankyrin repeat domain-containing protein [Rhodocyclaceae bacterium]|nr:ankyrin repeat domain-containing protein [Rhodocyclaceae bacterium]MDZ4214536.1 ankyrin repeat domain-containing protein [Rhodocyclaceae bacterium]